MLAVVRPGRLGAEAGTVEFDDDRLEVTLVHADHPDWVIDVSVRKRDAIVGMGLVHEHFDAPKRGVVQERPWTTEIVDFVAEILCGDIEIETIYRGSTPIVVRHFNRDDSGERRLLEHTGFLTPGRLLVWRRKRTEIETPSFR